VLHSGQIIHSIYVGPCHHSMVHPCVAYRGYGLQIWMVAANVLNKQSQPARGGPPAWRLERG